jgi:hypothetical protein
MGNNLPEKRMWGYPMAIAGLNYEVMNVDGLFTHNQFYMVPRYQRGYAWGVEEVRELLRDLSEAHDKFPTEDYLLGQMIVCPSSERIKSIKPEIEQWDLIDGQQRSTTLYLMMVVIGARVEATMVEPLSVAAKQERAMMDVRKTTPKVEDDNDYHPRIKTASNGDEFVRMILEGKPLGMPNGPTQANLQIAVQEINDHLDTFDQDKIGSFYRYVLSRVRVVRLELESAAHALRVFQKVNNRGLQLDDADLIKAYLFQTLSDNEFDDAAKKWEESTNNLFKARLKRVRAMEFLMKVLIGIRKGQSISTGELFETWKDELETSDQVKELMGHLPENAKVLVRISKGELPSGSKTDLSSGTYMASWIQQFEVLLAGKHLQPTGYETLLKMVEDRTMLSYWSKEPSQKFEQIIHTWAKSINKLDAFASEEDIWEASPEARNNFDDLSQRAFLGIRNLSYATVSHRDRIRYVLARVNRVVQQSVNVNAYQMSELLETSKQNAVGYDLDHVFPKADAQRFEWSVSETKNSELGLADRSEQVINSIGNLVLLHPIDNRSQSDSLPWDDEKSSNLGSSELYLNRLLVDPTERAKANVRIAKILKKYQSQTPSLASWGEDAVDAWAAVYWEILLSDIRKNLGFQDPESN